MKDNSSVSIDRRQLFSGVGALGVTLAASSGFAAEDKKHKHGSSDIFHAANHCEEQARLCLNHCISVFQEGGTSLAECARRVLDTASLCDALADQVASKSPYAGDLAKVCRRACVDCEEECRKHEKMHKVCKDCADSCVALIEAIDAM